MTTTAIRSAVLQSWLASAAPGEDFVYHRGDLATERTRDPAIAALADTMLKRSSGRFDVVSACGHIRGEIVGDGTVQLLQRRQQGEMVYFARKR